MQQTMSVSGNLSHVALQRGILVKEDLQGLAITKKYQNIIGINVLIKKIHSHFRKPFIAEKTKARTIENEHRPHAQTVTRTAKKNIPIFPRYI